MGNIRTDKEQILTQSTLDKSKKRLPAKELTAKVQTLLLKRFSRPEWASFFEVFNSETLCRADCIAFNMFPSRNYKIIGFEVKASRGDWLHELKNGKKADYFVGQCDEWYIVQAYDGIVKVDELPKGWGLKTMKGDRLYTKVYSNIKYKPVPSREFFVRMIEKSQDAISSQSLLHEAERRGYREGKNEVLNDNYELKKLKQKAELIDKLEEMGLYLWRLNKEEIENIVRVRKIISNIENWNMMGGLESVVKQVDDIKRISDDCYKLLSEIEGVNKDVK